MTHDEVESGVQLMLDRIKKIDVAFMLAAATETEYADGTRVVRCGYISKADFLKDGKVKSVVSAELIITVTEVAE